MSERTRMNDVPRKTEVRHAQGYGEVLHGVGADGPMLLSGLWRVVACDFRSPVSFDDERTRFIGCRFFGGRPDGPLTPETLQSCLVQTGDEWTVVGHKAES